MQLALVQPSDGKTGGQVDVADTTFDASFNETLIHQVVTAYMAGARSGTRAQKTRSEVRGGGAKPFRQKGTGRARAGSSRNPLWRGGGVTFAAKPQNHDQKLNKKQYRAAMRSILSELVRQERLVVVEEFSMDMPKTKQLVEKLNVLNLHDVLIVTDIADENLQLASRNLHNVHTMIAREVDPVSLVGFDKIVVTVPALRQLEERLG